MRISEVAKKFSISTDTLRYYEKFGLIDNVIKDETGKRFYNSDNILRINFIVHMKKAGVRLSKIKEYIDLVNLGDDTVKERKAILENEKLKLEKEMIELRKTMDYLDYKIDNYNKILK